MVNLLHVSLAGYSTRKFFIIISIVVSSLIIDSSLSNISDIISVSTSWGFSAFIAVVITYAVGQYLVLKFVKLRSMGIRSKSPHFNRLSIVVTIVQYVLIAIIVSVILQIFLNSYYYTSMLTWNLSISYAMAGIIMVILAREFFSWYRSNRNFIVLSYSVSFIITGISIVSAIVFFTIILLEMQDKITNSSSEPTSEQEEEPTSEQEEVGHGPEQEEVGHGPDIRKFDLSTILGKVQTVFVISQIVSFLSLWGSTAMLLHTYSKKLGKVKFWIIITIPLASFVSIFVIITPFVMSISSGNHDENSIIEILVVDALGYTLPALFSGLLFGLPFWMIARTLSYSSVLKDYMIIAGSGFALFELAINGSVMLASYPPLGLASVSSVGLSSYLILMGIYSSAISMSGDVKLRQTIRKSAIDESKLLVGIGSGQIEKKIEKKVIEMAKGQAASMMNQTGVQLSLTERDMKQYLFSVLKEIKVLQNVDEILKKGEGILQSSTEFLACSKFNGMRLVYNSYFDSYEEVMLNKYRKGEHKGIRWITSIIDKDTSDLVRLFLNIGVQIRHVKNMPPIDFAVSEKEMIATIEKMEGGELAHSLLVSNEAAYINHFVSIFEELWKDGIDAEDRIRDIEEGIDQANIEIISNPKEGIKRAWSIIQSAKEEVLIMFSSVNAVRRQMEMGGLRLLKSVSEAHNAKVRVLIPADADITSTTIKEEKSTYPHIDIRTIVKSLQTKISIVLVDKRECVIVELKEDTEDNSYDATGLTTYSNSKSIVSSYISIFESFWKQSELNEQLEEANKQLTEANEKLTVNEKMQKEFINVAAHELRTPIQPILGLSDILLTKDGNIEQYYGILNTIYRNAKRLQRLTEDILDVTRIDSQSLRLNKEEFILNDLVSSIVEEYKEEIRSDNRVNIRYSPTEDNTGVAIHADKNRIAQVISNLIDNAIKFTKEQGGSVSINIKRKENDNWVEVSIKDTGSGIDPEIMPRLFTKFSSKSFKGTGLGLYISKSIVEAHGGRIWAENNVDIKGATFSFSLPSLDQR
ncbi:MAG TPA: ATP-binding protein [Nitrososphaeraceae archaeon]|nr:ATP-binding protein [Nitrososphaeraceae archaeon]